MPKRTQGSIALGQQCDIVDHRPCDLSVSLGVALDTAQALNLPVLEKLQRIEQAGTISERQARRVFRDWAAQLQASPTARTDQKRWAAIVTETLFTS